MAGLSPDAVASAYVEACLGELDALKPGNVHRFAGGHGMEVEVFETSASVSAPFVAGAGLPLGTRILEAVAATRAAVGMNTNLGILLLCVPLALGAERAGRGTSVADAIRAVLAGLTEADAVSVFRAIALAAPGGLGTVEAEDARRPPTVGLVEAMRIAAPRDRIAHAYTDALADVFALGLPALAAARASGGGETEAATACFLAFASAFPDSHVARKYGPAAAERLRLRFAALCNRLKHNDDPRARRALLLDLDKSLKAEGLNPGTSADFTVASIFAAALLRKLEDCPDG